MDDVAVPLSHEGLSKGALPFSYRGLEGSGEGANQLCTKVCGRMLPNNNPKLNGPKPETLNPNP